MGILSFLGIGKRKKMVEEAINNGAIIVDVRTPGEFKTGHVDGSKNIPLDRIDREVERIKKMNKPIVFCCASGMRSGSATMKMKAEGIECFNGGSWTSLR